MLDIFYLYGNFGTKIIKISAMVTLLENPGKVQPIRSRRTTPYVYRKIVDQENSDTSLGSKPKRSL
jgi:hypothetical protein